MGNLSSSFFFFYCYTGRPDWKHPLLLTFSQVLCSSSVTLGNSFWGIMYLINGLHVCVSAFWDMLCISWTFHYFFPCDFHWHSGICTSVNLWFLYFQSPKTKINVWTQVFPSALLLFWDPLQSCKCFSKGELSRHHDQFSITLCIICHPWSRKHSIHSYTYFWGSCGLYLILNSQFLVIGNDMK